MYKVYKNFKNLNIIFINMLSCIINRDGASVSCFQYSRNREEASCIVLPI